MSYAMVVMHPGSRPTDIHIRLLVSHYTRECYGVTEPPAFLWATKTLPFHQVVTLVLVNDPRIEHEDIVVVNTHFGEEGILISGPARCLENDFPHLWRSIHDIIKTHDGSCEEVLSPTAKGALEHYLWGNVVIMPEMGFLIKTIVQEANRCALKMVR
ncbi:hypothetical protein ACLPJK_26625 [Pseudomonas aeruginosa]|uniref:hypothetical protein n=1 Tax=Pseudomonas aeruginosa TaxID=287 RepID=UPI003D296757